jgi:hypothetical protein
VSDISIADITDGSSNTIMFGEMSWDVGPQAPWIVGSASMDGTSRAAQISSAFGVIHNAKNIRHGINKERHVNEDGSPANNNLPGTETSLGSYHPGGAHVVLSDGSATFLRDETDVEGVLRRMASRASEDIFQLP